MNKVTPLDQDFRAGAVGQDPSTKIQKNVETRPSILEFLRKFALSVTDPRRTDRGNIRYRLADVIMLLVLARLSGCVWRADIIEFGWHNLAKFRKMNMFMNGIPSEPTLCRIGNSIDAQDMVGRMLEFSKQYHGMLLKECAEREIICIDGKAERGTVLANGRNPDIVSAYSPATGQTLATEACQEKSNEIKAIPLLLDKLEMSGKIFTADAMAMQKSIVDIICNKSCYYLIELKANQRSLRYGVEDRLKQHEPVYEYTDGPELGHGRIETRTYRVYEGRDIVVDKEKWGADLTIVEFESVTVIKQTGASTTETRLYVTNLPADTPRLGDIVRRHWAIESMHWDLDRNLWQDRIKRKTAQAARNLDTIQRIVLSVFSIWKGLRRKRSDKRKGVAELMRYVSMSFARLKRFLSQK